MERYLTIWFGETEISSSSITGEVNRDSGGKATAIMKVPNDLLAANEPDYRSEVSIYSTTNGEEIALFTGFVESVTLKDYETHMSFITQTQIMEELRIGGLSIENVDSREMMWALSVLGGYEEDKVIVQGWSPSVEKFSVATPIDGIYVDDAFTVGNVTLYPEDRLSNIASQMDSDTSGHLQNLYSGASAWAVVTIVSSTLYGAEKKGLEDIERSLAWLTARIHFSSAHLPEGNRNAYKRERTKVQVSRRDLALVSGTTTGRKWLRVSEVLREHPNLSYEEFSSLQSPKLPLNTPTQTREAINTWRRAAESTDLLTGVVALWEAVSFYAANTSLDKIFAKEELKIIKENATKDLEGEKKQRIKEVLSQVNNAPLMVQLKKAMEEDGVPYTEQELALLKKLRDTRNNLVHGRSVEEPNDKDFRYAAAIVGRMLVYRVAKLNN